MFSDTRYAKAIHLDTSTDDVKSSSDEGDFEVIDAEEADDTVEVP